jgi:hypothetical protein
MVNEHNEAEKNLTTEEYEISHATGESENMHL